MTLEVSFTFLSNSSSSFANEHLCLFLSSPFNVNIPVFSAWCVCATVDQQVLSILPCIPRSGLSVL